MRGRTGCRSRVGSGRSRWGLTAALLLGGALLALGAPATAGAETYREAVEGTTGLIHLWPMGESSGSSLADAKGGANAALSSSGVTLGQPGGLVGDSSTSALFDGSSGAAHASVDLSGTHVLTVEFWMKWGSFASDDHLALEFTANFNEYAGGFLVDPDATPGSDFAVSIGKGGSRNTVFFARPSAGEWHHYAFVIDTAAAAEDEITPYVDGHAVSYTKSESGTGAGSFASSTLFWMSRDASTLFGAGSMQDLALYDSALAAGTIAAHYEIGAGGPKAAFGSWPAVATAGVPVRLDASGSSSPGGSITDYAWDFDGSKSYGTEAGESSSESHTFSAPGTYTVDLRVKDSLGQTATVSHTITVGAALGAYEQAVEETSAASHFWPMGEASGSSLADVLGGANAELSSSGVSLGQSGALVGDSSTAAAFDGSTGAAHAELDLSGTHKLTIEFWLKWNAFAENDDLAMELTQNFNEHPGGFLVDPNATGSGKFGVGLGEGAARNNAFFARPAAEAWHYYALVLDTTASGATQITPYVDGHAVSYTKSAEGTEAGAFAKAALYWMSRNASSLFGAGSMQDLALYETTLSAGTIAEHYELGEGGLKAAFTSVPVSASVGVPVHLDASGSSSPMGSITDYAWDFDGGKSYATDEGATSSLTHTFFAPGTYTVDLRVKDSLGQAATVSHSITVGAQLGQYERVVEETPGAQHFWPMSESSGSAFADLFAGSNAELSSSGVSLGQAGGLVEDPATAASFDGSAGAAHAPLDLSGTGEVTVEFWMKWKAYANDDALALELTPNFNEHPGGFLVDPNSPESGGTFGVGVADGSARNNVFFTRPSAEAWHYYALAIDTKNPGGTVITPYVDGHAVSYTKSAEGTEGENLANSTLYWFSRDASSLHGAGSMQDLAIYGATLGSDTILEHYELGKDLQTPAPNSAIRYAYDADRQLKAAVDPASETAFYNWDAAGNLETLKRKSSEKLSVIEMTPERGAAGETVRIAGTGFSPTKSADVVKFNGTEATVTAASEWNLTVKVPSGTTSGTVTVQTLSEGPVTSAQSFTVAGTAAPSISSLSSSIAAPGSEVTISGSNFESSTMEDDVVVNRARTDLLSATSSAIKFKVPGLTGSGPVSVATPEGATVGPDLFIPPSGYSTSQIAPTAAATEGEATSLNITAAGTVGLAVVEGRENEYLYVALSKYTIHSGYVFIYGPENTKIGEGYFNGAGTSIEPVKLPASGFYTILVKPEGSYTGNIELTPYVFSNVAVSLALSTSGVSEKVSLTVPGQAAVFNVSLSAGQEASADLSESTLSGEYYEEWYAPEGGFIESDRFSGNGPLYPLVASATGVYKLVINPLGSATGSFKLTASTPTTTTISPSTSGAATTVTTKVPAQTARISFEATAGEDLYLRASEVTMGSGTIEIKGPSGAHVDTESFNSGGITTMTEPISLPSTGMYTLVVRPSGENTGSMKLTAYKVENISSSLVPTTSGVTETVSLGTPGESAAYSVEVTAGEEVSLDASEDTVGEFYEEWYKPDGSKLESERFTGAGPLEPITFPTAGTYKLVIKPWDGATGTIKLIAATPVTSSVTPTTGGEAVTVTTNAPAQAAKVSFEGTAEEEIHLALTEITINSGKIALYGPTGSQLSGTSYSFHDGEERTFETVTLPSTGTYTALIRPEAEWTGSAQLTAYLDEPGGFSRPLTRAQALFDPTPNSPAQRVLITGLPPEPFATLRAATQLPRNLPLRLTDPVGRKRLSARHRSTLQPDLGPHRGVPALPSALRAFHPARLGIWHPTRRGHSTIGVTDRGESPWSRLAPLPGTPGVTALAGQALQLGGLPLKGLRVAIDGTYLAARTDSSGRFLIQGAPAGHQVLVVEGSALHGAVRYGDFEIGVQVKAHEETTLDGPIWMTPLDPAGERHVASPTRRETRLTTPAIPGLEVRIPAGSVITGPTGRVVRKLNITAIPVDRPPFPLPPFVTVPLYFTVQPGRAYLSKGAQIVYPNWGHLPAGQRVPFWNYDPDQRGWYVYGHGTVTADGRQVVPDANVRVWEFTGAMITATPTPPGLHTHIAGGGTFEGEPVDVGTGLFIYHETDLVLPDVIPIKIERTYRQADLNSYSFGIGTSSLYDMRLWSENNYHEADLILPEGGRVHYVRTSPGESFREAVYESTSNPGLYYASTIKWNGNGWNLTLTNGTTYVFGENAPLQAIQDRFGNQLTLTRAGGTTGNITRITSPHDRWVTLSYDGSNRITEITDNGGRHLKYSYNAQGTLEQVTDAAGRTTTYEYEGSNKAVGGFELTTVRDGRGHTVLTNEYRPACEETSESTCPVPRIVKQTLGDGGVYAFSYTESEAKKVEATTTTDPRKNQNKASFNSEGALISDTKALGTAVEETTTYEPQAGSGLLLSSTDPLGRKTTYEYDSSGNLTQKTLLAETASARTLKYTYEPGTNELASFTDALEHTTTYHYGEHGELLSRTDPLGHTTSYEYSPEGQPTAIENTLGKKTKLTYELGDLTAVTDPLGRVTKRFVDAIGRLGSVTAAGGQRTRLKYDADNELTKLTDPLGAATSYEYDNAGDLAETVDPQEHTTTRAYETVDRLESETDALEHTSKDAYDEDGDLTEYTYRDGKLAKFSYDELDRLTEARYGVSGEGAESTIKYEYDLGNRLSKVVDSASGTYTPEYDEFNRLESIATPGGTIEYEYDEADRRTSMTAPGQEALKYSYDEANRLTELKRGSQVVKLAYDNANRPTTTTLPDGVEERYRYDDAGEPTAIVYKKGSTTLGELHYSYDPNGREEAVWGSYARSGLPEAVSSTAYNADNEQTERNGKELTYDANGNLISDGSSEYKWNARNQLAEITGAVSASFGYDPFGRRISKTLGETTTKVLFDGPNAVQETQGSSTANLLTGLLPDSTYARSTGSATESLLSDALGSVIGLGNGEGEVETAYTYDPFGGTSREGATSGNPFQYAGRENDGGGLYFDRARYYNPAGARFIGQDPLGEVDGPNLYRYADNSPLNLSDPYGTTPHEEGTRRIWQAAEEEAGGKTRPEPNFDHPEEPPGPGWEWKGKGSAGSKEGSWINPGTREKLYPDLEHEEPIGPHYDYTAPDGSQYRIYPDGRMELKQ